MARKRQAARDAARDAVAAAETGTAGTRDTATTGRVGNRSHSHQDPVSWSRSGLIEGTSDGKMPSPWLRTWGWWLLPLVIIGLLVAMIWGINHIENDVEQAAPEMLREAGIDPAGLEFEGNYRNVEVRGVLPAGVSAQQVEVALEGREGPADREDIRSATILATAAAPAPLGDIDVTATSDGATITLTGNVPSQEYADTLVAAAEESGATVVNNLTVSGLDASAADAGSQIDRLAAVLPALGSGVLSADLFLSDDDLTGTIDAADADSAAVIGALVDSGVTVGAPDPLGNLDVSSTYDGTNIVLDGDVLSEAQSAELQAAAEAVVGAGNVVNNLNVLGLDEAIDGSDAKVAALAGAIDTFAGLETGDATLTDTDFTINGVALDDAARAATEGALDDGSNAGLRPGGDLTVVEDQGPSLEEEIVLLQVELDSLQEEIRENVVFATDSAELTAGAQATLDKVVAAMVLYGRPVVETGGHTDSQASDEYNLNLSQQRADSVVAYLESQGIDAGRLLAIGFGESLPIAENTSEPGRLQNRRVEFIARENF